MIRFRNISIDQQRRVITHDGVTHKFLYDSKRFQLLKHLILSRGLTSRRLFVLLYESEENGGPLYGPEVIRVMIAHLKPELHKLGLKLKVERYLGKNKLYSVTP